MKIVIITGMSGAGKSACLNVFEDMGYYAIDNLPPVLLKEFISLSSSNVKKIERLACVVDIRGGVFFKDLLSAISDLREIGTDVSVVYLNASDSVLIRRYKEKRRPHPLSAKGSLMDGIQEERTLLLDVQNIADHVIDTDHLTLGQLKNKIQLYYYGSENDLNFHINIVSFGYKNGILLDGDNIFDVRFLPNPYYVDELKEKTGLSREVRDFVLQFEETEEFLNRIVSMMQYLIPRYKKEGKTNLVIGIGCTGGKHRSVVIATELSKRLESEACYVSHRDSHLW